MSEKIEILIAKYFSDGLSSDEIQRLMFWIEASKKNKRKLNDYIDLNVTIEQLKSEGQDDSLLWKHIESSYKVPVRKLNYRKYAAAASVLLIVALTIFINKERGVEFIIDAPAIVNNNIEIGTDKATLTLEDGTNVNLEKGQQYISDNLESNGEEILYKPSSSVKQEIAYNYLTIPRGGQYFVKLSDGTQVWLNSESKLKYPVNFIKGETRNVELVYGEAYFAVSPSTAHNDAKFTVSNLAQEIEVIGTEFNIKAYNDEEHVYTTLVEGKVKISADGLKEILKPSYQSTVSRLDSNISVGLVDVKDEISWKNGVFSFKGKSLKDIMKVMSRWYDIDVIFVNKDLESVKFKGVLEKSQSIEDVMSVMASSTINSYEINNKVLMLK